MNNPANPTNAYTVPSVSITTARTGASRKSNALGMRAMLERTIGGSFANEPLSQYGFYWDWQAAPQWNLCNAPGVEVVATYKRHNINRVRLENRFHRLFGAAQLDLTIEDRFGNPVKPREWFPVPLPVIDEAVQRIRHHLALRLKH